MPRLVPESLKLSTVARRYFSGLALLQMLMTTLPAHAETLTVPLQAEAIQPAKPDKITCEYVKDYFTDTGKLLASPVNWSGNDWMKAGLIVGATSGLLFADADIRSFSQRNQSSTGDKGAAVGNALGNPLYALPTLGLFYLYGHLNDDPKARRASLLAAESLTISGVFSLALKVTAQRPRPFTGEAPDSWNGPRLKMSDDSFPSVHSTTAFSIASVLAEEYGNNPFVPPVVYGLAALTGFARIYVDKHWASDVFFGGTIGYLVGKAVVRYHTIRSDTAVRILPTVSRQGFSLMAEYRF